MEVYFTPTERRILSLLSDGLPHTKDQLRGCLNDEMAEPHGVAVHVSAIRKRLRPSGQDILAERRDGTCYYRHIRIVASAYSGKS